MWPICKAFVSFSKGVTLGYPLTPTLVTRLVLTTSLHIQNLSRLLFHPKPKSLEHLLLWHPCSSSWNKTYMLDPGSLGKMKGKGSRGERKNKTSFWCAGPLHCLSSLCVWTACKNYATSNISFTSKSFGRKSSPSSEAELPCTSPARVLNQAFICLPIGTDAKCPWHTHPPNNLNLIWGFRPSWLKKIAYDLLGSHPPQHRQLWTEMLMFMKEQLPRQHRVQRKGPWWYQNRGEWSCNEGLCLLRQGQELAEWWGEGGGSNLHYSYIWNMHLFGIVDIY